MTQPQEDETRDTTSPIPSRRIVSVQFDRYTIKVELGGANEFLGVVEVGVNQDFRSLRQRIESQGSHDVSDFYDIES